MRAWAALIILTIVACAALASHSRKPFELRIDGAADAKPANWPTNAAASAMPERASLVCMYVYVPGPLEARQRPIART